LTYFYGFQEIDAKGLYVVDNDLKVLDGLKIGMIADFCLVDSQNKVVFKIENGLILYIP
jgi:hypothetical protein